MSKKPETELVLPLIAKVKEEPVTPPRKSPTYLNLNGITEALIPQFFGDDSQSKTGTDDKKDIGPVKSSNDLLLELFGVFNAAPPPELLTLGAICADEDGNLQKTHSGKKKHKKKHKKKSKRKGRSSSDEEESENEDKKRRKKRLKKTEDEKVSENEKKGDEKDEKHRRKRSSKTVTGIDEKGKESAKNSKSEKDLNKKSSKTVPKDSEKLSIISKSKEKNKEKDKEKEKSSSHSTKNIEGTKEEAPTDNKVDATTTEKPGKIVIKDLKFTKVFEESKRKEEEDAQKRKEKKHRHKERHRRIRGHSSPSNTRELSDISLSDEETYLREKQSSSNDYNYHNDYYHNERHGRRGGARDEGRYDARSRIRSRRNSNHDRSRSRGRRSYSRDNDLKIDKKRLLEIARKNAITMLKSGQMPGTEEMQPEDKIKALNHMQYGGKSVEELTDFCRKLTNGEPLNDLLSISSENEGDSDHDTYGNSVPFHHPFVLKDRGPIVMNIKNATPIPPKSADQTKAILMQFPVSSGTHHRLNESEWKPVVQKKEKPAPVAIIPPATQQPKVQNPRPEKFTQQQQTPAFVVPPLEPPPPLPTFIQIPPPQHHLPFPPLVKLPPPQPLLAQYQTQPMQPNMQQPPPMQTESIFPKQSPADPNLDVSTIVTQRLNAMRKLENNPLDSEAIKLMYSTQKEMSQWAASKFTPGQFTGSTGANILSAKELAGGQQAWVKRDQLTATAPVSGGMGMHLLQKMGWRPGEGLGKDKSGALQPLLLEIKLDKKGLVANEDNPNNNQVPQSRQRGNNRKQTASIAQTKAVIESKHPVSLLGELAAKRRWDPPTYEVVSMTGPGHNRNFLFSVIVDGNCYQPPQASNTKKEAKAVAAKFALTHMGILSG